MSNITPFLYNIKNKKPSELMLHLIKLLKTCDFIKALNLLFAYDKTNI